MRTWLKSHIQRQLERFARQAIGRYKPLVVGIAGSVGKTSTKEAAFHVLSQSYSVRKSTKSYNNEFGVPLTILGLDSGRSSIISWVRILREAARVAHGKTTYPQCLLLELGSDHMGDIQKLMEIAKPTVGVLTAVAPVHLEYFENFENVKKEESTIIRLLGDGAKGIVNADDADALASVADIAAPIITFGTRESAKAQAQHCELVRHNNEFGTRFTLIFAGEEREVFIAGAIAQTHVSAVMGAAAVGFALGIPIDDIVVGLERFTPAPGRMHLVDGIKRTKLIDDTYNSSPKAAKLALDVLAAFPDHEKRIAVLGDMAELGNHTEAMHTEVGGYCVGKIDVLITVGEKARDFARGARNAGMDDSHMFSFSEADDAGKFLQERMHEGDVVLIKGSQVSRLEKIVREVMAEPQRAGELLVRQEAYWNP